MFKYNQIVEISVSFRPILIQGLKRPSLFLNRMYNLVKTRRVLELLDAIVQLKPVMAILFRTIRVLKEVIV